MNGNGADNVLDVKNLSVSFRTVRGTVQALRNVSLMVPKNKIVGIVGESGCGKSTLINSMLRLLAANSMVGDSSSIAFQGREVLAMNERDLQAMRGQKISMVFQDPMTALNPVISIGTQMTDILYRQPSSMAEKRERAAAMLGQVGIPDPVRRLDDYPHQFSGGMRQRICIAMALMMNPSLLIADEPTTALDVTLEAQIIHLMKELREQFECSMLFVSHNLGLIAELCDEVIVMYAGEVVEQGKVHDLFHRAQHPYTQMLLECDPARIAETSRDLPTISGSVPDLVDLPPGCIFSPRCPKRYEPCNKAPPDTFNVNDIHSARCFQVRDA
ncbi:MAG: peptide ABC transporter ATP-binding protein [Rhodospirillaceae bacterium]|nr:peptide ABC transporter ATP-binding protein [Rhodospirillaceae bacterium]|tara:strand:- start:5401 stop:6387 length:987 start_codon:yes stop_codon:yes gene_type:complete